MKYVVEIPDEQISMKPYRFWPFRNVGWQVFWSVLFLGLGGFCLYEGAIKGDDFLTLSLYLGIPFVFLGIVYLLQIALTMK